MYQPFANLSLARPTVSGGHFQSLQHPSRIFVAKPLALTTIAFN
jgi:hypothetical protein